MLGLCSMLAVAAASIALAQGDPTTYTICGADRGYTEADSLAAARYLTERIIRSDSHPLEVDECVFAHVNTTIISLCNGNASNRVVSRAEVQGEIDLIIKDCGLEGGFTGIRVVNNMTVAVFGIDKFNYQPPAPPGSPEPDLPGAKSASDTAATLETRADDVCAFGYDGKPRTDCNWKYKLNQDGSCGEPTPGNKCEVFCELKRFGLRGHEERLPGEAGNRFLPGVDSTITKQVEVSVSNGFSITVDGIAKEVIGAGVTYAWTMTKTTATAVSLQGTKNGDFASRWVYFPKLIASCGSVSKRKYSVEPRCSHAHCLRKKQEESCTGDVVTVPNVCSIVAKLNPDGQAEVDWALRLEKDDGVPLPIENQTPSYKAACPSLDPDNDGERECYNPLPARRVMMRNFEAEDRAARLARAVE